MKSFTYDRVSTPRDALTAVLRRKGGRFIAGGTNLLDLMKHEIETPEAGCASGPPFGIPI
jgi:xanthine dehydrogenase YagS FAD-binding subunit